MTEQTNRIGHNKHTITRQMICTFFQLYMMARDEFGHPKLFESCECRIAYIEQQRAIQTCLLCIFRSQIQKSG